MTKSVFIKTYGCQMNVYDSARMADVLAPLGYAPVDEPDDAEIVILNTCHIREKAAEKVYSELGRLKRLKLAKARRGERLLIAVAGCVAQAEGEEIRRRAPQVDMVFGPQAYHRLPAMLAQLDRAGGAVLDTEFDVAPKFDALPEESVPPGFSAFVTVQEGCDKFCTFCVVPYTRGAEYSRPPAAIEAEARRLVARGAVELTLLGQNVNAYHGRDGGGKEAGLASLIRRLAAIRGLERIRYTTSHPRDVDEALIAVHGEEHKLMPFLHLPVQAGSDRILAAMNRGYGAAEYLDVVARLRRARPDIALSSDFIVGFPGESEADFAATIELVEAVGFASAYSFKYSPRPGTPAAARDDQVADDVKEDRLQRLQALLRRQQDAFNRAMAGRVISVLIEGEGRHAGQLVGRSPYMQPVHLCAPRELIGALRDVRIDTVHPHSLSGSLVGGDERIAAAATAEALR